MEHNTRAKIVDLLNQIDEQANVIVRLVTEGDRFRIKVTEAIDMLHYPTVESAIKARKMLEDSLKSRSQLRREAIQKGVPMPDFEAKP